MRVLIVVFIIVSAALALVQYNSSITFIAQLMGISWGALAGAFLGPFLWGLYSCLLYTSNARQAHPREGLRARPALGHLPEARL